MYVYICTFIEQPAVIELVIRVFLRYISSLIVYKIDRL